MSSILRYVYKNVQISFILYKQFTTVCLLTILIYILLVRININISPIKCMNDLNNPEKNENSLPLCFRNLTLTYNGGQKLSRQARKTVATSNIKIFLKTIW